MSRHSDLRELKRLTVQERSHLGLVRFRKQHMVPDVGGLGWRTKTGHLLKNQSYFPQKHPSKHMGCACVCWCQHVAGPIDMFLLPSDCCFLMMSSSAVMRFNLYVLLFGRTGMGQRWQRMLKWASGFVKAEFGNLYHLYLLFLVGMILRHEELWPGWSD